MFLGHFALGFASKKLNSRPSLGTYFMAAQFLDLLWPMLLIRGVEKVRIEPGNTEFTPLNFVYYPYSHSLVAAIGWGVLFGGIHYLSQRDKRSSLLLGVLVLSHWILDFIMHRPDLPLSPWTAEKFGLGLWNNKMATLVIEVIMFIGGAILYLKATSPRNNAGRFAFWSFIAFMLAIYFFTAFGHPPDSVDSIAIMGISQVLLILWGYWIDANRTPTTGQPVVPRYGGTNR